MSEIELIILQLVSRGEGKYSWYEIAQGLSRLDVPREPDMLSVLKKLEIEGLLTRRIEPDSPRDSWELTGEGRKIV